MKEVILIMDNTSNRLETSVPGCTNDENEFDAIIKRIPCNLHPITKSSFMLCEIVLSETDKSLSTYFG